VTSKSLLNPPNPSLVIVNNLGLTSMPLDPDDPGILVQFNYFGFTVYVPIRGLSGSQGLGLYERWHLKPSWRSSSIGCEKSISLIINW